MISPISVEEKQKLIEIVAIDDVANILNEITKFSFYEDPDQRKFYSNSIYFLLKLPSAFQYFPLMHLNRIHLLKLKLLLIYYLYL